MNRHNKTCYELFSYRKHGLLKLHLLRCPCTALSKERVPKMEPKVVKCFFLGFYANSLDKRVSIVLLELLAYHVDFNVHGVLPTGKGPNWVFDYKRQFESFDVYPDVSTCALEKVIS